MVNPIEIHTTFLKSMKIPFYFMISLLFISATMIAQEQPAEKKESSDQKKQDQQEQSAPPFVDENGDGINDNAMRLRDPGNSENDGRQTRQRRRDRFVDEDGDGIHDGRCNGMAILPGRRRGQQKGGQK